MMPDWIIYIPVLIWLGILSWYDIKIRGIPHSAWVIIPLILAGIYRIRMGGWQLVILIGLIVAVSEREWIAIKIRWGGITSIFGWVPILTVVFCMAAPISPIGVMAILGFWLAWELKWWGGADAVVGIIIMSIWPYGVTMVCLTISNLVNFIWDRFIYNPKNPKIPSVPGIPIFLSTIILKVIHISLLHF